MSGSKRPRDGRLALKPASVAQQSTDRAGGRAQLDDEQPPHAKRARLDDAAAALSSSSSSSLSSAGAESSAGGTTEASVDGGLWPLAAWLRTSISVASMLWAYAASWWATVLVKVGASGNYLPFSAHGLVGKNVSGVLETLASSKLFGHKLTGVDLSVCTVHVLKGGLPDDMDQPTAADEADASKFVELKGAKTVAVAAKEGECKGKRLFIHVRLPVVTGSAPAAGTPAALLRATLPYAKLESIAGEPADGCQLLALYNAAGEPVEWPGLYSNKLFIRPVYREFFERADMFNRGLRRAFAHGDVDTLVRGIPGIGKSSFALYCLWRLVTQEKRHVLYDYPKAMGKDVTVEFGAGDFSEAVYIADGVEPRRAAGIKLLVASPHQDTFHEFKKNALSFFMPEPTHTEIRLLRDLCFDDVDDDALEDRIDFWGRVPRMVVGSSATYEDEDRKATARGLREEPLRRLLLNMEEAGSKEEDVVSFRVVHYGFPFDTAADYTWAAGQKPARDYGLKAVSLRWASPHMEDLVWAFVSDAVNRNRSAPST